MGAAGSIALAMGTSWLCTGLFLNCYAGPYVVLLVLVVDLHAPIILTVPGEARHSACVLVSRKSTLNSAPPRSQSHGKWT